MTIKLQNIPDIPDEFDIYNGKKFDKNILTSILLTNFLSNTENDISHFQNIRNNYNNGDLNLFYKIVILIHDLVKFVFFKFLELIILTLIILVLLSIIVVFFLVILFISGIIFKSAYLLYQYKILFWITIILFILSFIFICLFQFYKKIILLLKNEKNIELV